MKALTTTVLAALLCACSSSNSVPAPQRQSMTPVPTIATPKDGDYHGKGKLTKVDNSIGSVGLDHEDIPGLMPRMIMEFYVSDKALLQGLEVGDDVTFTVRYDKGTEKVTAISKAK